ncbi:M28 family metallopeptidase [Stratiformator vulcanicus]|uniref:Aminopeptidase YwaD n=1 Tax=Stratiformator vulcanicus TaxID=2527980 RepID=A0A517R7M4_9PLAN|nr:M28 family peptidase [Stratiformator vulcanicus]QDT39862.1 Aminopeptidase YwaD precursor [Stratiformator vulcanicus]
MRMVLFRHLLETITISTSGRGRLAVDLRKSQQPNEQERPRKFLKRLLVPLVLSTAILPSVAPAIGEERSAEVPLIVGGDVRPHVEFLAAPEQGGRPGGVAIASRNYLVEQFRVLGLEPLFGNSYLQPIPGRTHFDEDGKPLGTAGPQGFNVGALLRGSDPELRDEVIILSAHYDHLGRRGNRMYPGADDNASGVAMMLEVADRLALAKRPHKRSIAFVGFDLEERLLFGSRYFAANMPFPQSKLKLFITADMIGRSLGGMDYDEVFVLGAEHAPYLSTQMSRIGVPDGLDVLNLGIELIGTRSDYGPFRDRDIPFLFFSTGVHPDYHTPRDTAERIDFDNLGRISTLVYRTVVEVANDPITPTWQEKAPMDLGEVRILNTVATRLLNRADAQNLNAIQRLTISQAKSRSGTILRRGTMTQDERIWLTRLARLMLLTSL